MGNAPFDPEKDHKLEMAITRPLGELSRQSARQTETMPDIYENFDFEIRNDHFKH